MLNIVKQRLVPPLCSILPPPVWHKLLTINLIVPHWHIISDEVQPHISGLYTYRNTKQFKADIDFFLKYYEPVSLSDIISYLDGRIKLPKRCFLPTFDDGFREIHDVVAPILQEHGIPAVFFLITSVIDNIELCYPQKKSLLINALTSRRSASLLLEVSHKLNDRGINGKDVIDQIRNIPYHKRHLLAELASILECDFLAYVSTVEPYLTSNQIKTLLKKGFDLGAHSIDHPLFSELTTEEQLIQTYESIKFIKEQFQYNCEAFAFPYSDSKIPSDYFQRAFADGYLKVSFGIGGIQYRSCLRNLPRFSMERTNLPAKQILAKQFGRTLLRKHSYY